MTKEKTETLPIKLRKVTKLVGTKWETIMFAQLRTGDVFRLYDNGSDGSDTIETGVSNIALSDPYLVNKVYTIKCDEI